MGFCFSISLILFHHNLSMQIMKKGFIRASNPSIAFANASFFHDIYSLSTAYLIIATVLLIRQELPLVFVIKIYRFQSFYRLGLFTEDCQ